MRIILANFQLSSFKTVEGDRGDRQTFLPAQALLKNLNSTLTPIALLVRDKLQAKGFF